MPEYAAPGVYVEEVERGPKPIEGVSTSVAGFLGQTERGPTEPRLVTSYPGFQRVFGGPIDGSFMAHAVKGFFDNGGSRCYVTRVTPWDQAADATVYADEGGFEPAPPGVSGGVLRGREALDFETVSSGSSEKKTVEVKNVSGTSVDITKGDIAIEYDGSSNPFSVETKPAKTVSAGDKATVEIKFAPSSGDPEEAVLKVPHDGVASTSPVRIPLYGNHGVMEATAIGPGLWGENVAIRVEPATLYDAGENDLFKLVIRYWADDAARVKAEANDAKYEDLPVPAPDVEEVYDNLSPHPSSSNYYVSEVGGPSNLVDLEQLVPEKPKEGVTWLSHPTPGASKSLDVTDFTGTSSAADERVGLQTFQEVDEVTMLCVPDENQGSDTFTNKLRTALVDHCKSRKDRMAILQEGENPGPVSNVSPPVSTSYAAFYYPWVNVTDPATGNTVTVPPGGHVAGIYARTDSEVGVHKAPANEVLNGVLSLSTTITKNEQKTLNPRGVNCIRSFRGRGIRLWGARTASSDPAWKYINVRRLFMFVEESIQEGTQWVVFEPNDEDLWARVRQTVSNFLTGLWEDGALMGTTPGEAFYVKCDRSTMTQSDIDNGRLICEIGIAPVKPAEFVVFRISQWTAGAEGGG